MSAIQNLSNLVALLTGGSGQTIFDWKDNRVGSAAAASPVAGRMTSLWQYNGARGFGSVASSTAEVPTNATDGALKQTDPAGGKQLWLVGGGASSNTIGTLILYDRLAQESGSSGTVTTAQTLSLSPTRYTSTESVGNLIAIEITTAIGTTATTVSCSYTNQDGTSGHTTQLTAFGGTGLNEAQRFIILPLAQGDTGVRSVESVTVTATTGTAGNFTVLVVRPLLYVPLPAIGQANLRDLISGLPGPIEIKTDACLAWAWHANTTTVPQVFANLVMVEQ